MQEAVGEGIALACRLDARQGLFCIDPAIKPVAQRGGYGRNVAAVGQMRKRLTPKAQSASVAGMRLRYFDDMV